MVDTLRNETNMVEDTLETKVDEDLNKISRKLIGPLVRNYTVLNVLQEQLLHMRRNVTKGINRIGEMNQKIERLDLAFVPRWLERIETIRWPATFGVLGSLLFFCFLLYCGVCRHSRCLLILFSVLGEPLDAVNRACANSICNARSFIAGHLLGIDVALPRTRRGRLGLLLRPQAVLASPIQQRGRDGHRLLLPELRHSHALRRTNVESIPPTAARDSQSHRRVRGRLASVSARARVARAATTRH